MGELFWNKIAGSALAALLVVFVLNEAGHIVYHPHELEEDAYPWEVVEETAGGAAVEEGPVDFGLLLANADISTGERVARQCAACHTFVEGGATVQGPNLWNVVGRTAGQEAGFGYSAAMSALGQAWTYEVLYEYLENPRRYLPGTNMSFAGVRSDESRINLIAYLRSLSDNPAALPDPLPEAPVEDTAADGEPTTDVASDGEDEAPAEDAGEPG